MNAKAIESLFDDWNNALQTGDAKQVVALYQEDAILLPTVSNKVRTNHAEIEDYFTHFLQNKPYGKIDESHVRIFNDIAIHSGIYTFTFNGETTVQARFTFAYQNKNNSWKIIEHHSSRMPEG